MTSAAEPAREREQQQPGAENGSRHHGDHDAALQHHVPGLQQGMRVFSAAELARPRRDNVAVIAALAPSSLSFLSIPLTPARRARLDALMLQGLDPVATILDFLDDEIFSVPAPSGNDLGSATRTLPNSLGGCGND